MRLSNKKMFNGRFKQKVIVSLCTIFVLGSINYAPSIYGQTLVLTLEAEDMTKEGPYVGNISYPFLGVALYANGDSVSTNHNFTKAGEYQISIIGASSNQSQAGVSMYIGESKKGTTSFNNTSASTKNITFTLNGDEIGNKEIKLVLETDNGINDTFIDCAKLYFVADRPAAPVPPKVGAAATGNYRNMFAEYGITQTQVQEKVGDAWNQLFYGDNQDERIYYPVGNDMAYIKAIDSNDIRSEGMSYGMMI